MTEPAGEAGLETATTRLEAFSDGVLAIVVTLLILDVKVPVGAHGHLGSELADQWPRYAAYLSSFLIVGTIWLNHAATIRLVARTDHLLQVLNLLLLLPVSVLPWPTAVVAEYAREGTAGDQRLAVLLYGATSTLISVAFNLVWRYVVRHRELQRPGVPADQLAVRTRRYTLGLAAYPVATLLGLLSVPLFLALTLGLALFYLLPTPEVRGPAAA